LEFSIVIIIIVINVRRFATFEDVAWFEKTLKRVAEEDLGERLSEYTESTRVFVDFMR
jgi:hypothetical protein